MKPSIIDFVTDPHLLGPHFLGPSWDRWRAVLRAAFALPMSSDDLALFHEVAGDRTPPAKPVRELVCAVGRGGGKDSIASALATFIACTAPTDTLRPGEKNTVLLIATDRDQARIAHSYIAGYFDQTPLLHALAPRRYGDELVLDNGSEIVVGTNSMRSVRGRRYCCAIYDEVAFWSDESYANPDVEVDAAIAPGLARCPGSLKILISSVHRRAGLLYQRYDQSYGRDDPDTLVVLGDTLKFNPTFDAKTIDDAIARDFERYSAEYNCRWRDDLVNFLDLALIENAVDPGVTVRPPQPRLSYIAFADPSGGRGDSFTCAIAHVDGETAVLDAVYEKRAPFDPSVAVAEIAALLDSYGLGTVTGDRYAANWVTEGFGKVGVAYSNSERDRSQLYLDAIPLFTSGRARLLDNPRLIHQFASLERRTSPLGKDRIDHGPNGHDDLCNAAAGALVACANDPNEIWARLAG